MTGRVIALGALAFLIAALVVVAVLRVAGHADRLDDERAEQAAAAAFGGLRSGIGGIVLDNALWDDAARATLAPDGLAWMASTWGLTSRDYPLFSDVFVLDASGETRFAWSDGAPRDSTPDRFFKGIEGLFESLRDRVDDHVDHPVITAFAETVDGLAVFAIAPILPLTDAVPMARADANYLVLSRPIDADVLGDLARTHVIGGLRIGPAAAGELSIALPDWRGNPVTTASWPSVRPGWRAVRTVAPLLAAAFGLLAIFLAGYSAFGMSLIGEAKADQKRARHQATHDRLSGLLNRAGMNEAIAALSAGPNNGNIALIYLDLDGFKDVNDSHGHTTGDMLICAVASALTAQAPPGASVCRLGGDEFAILLPCNSRNEGIERLAMEIHARFGIPLRVDAHPLAISASIGIAVMESREADPLELLRRADVAMYRAKDLGRSRTVFYHPSFDNERRRGAAMESELRTAIDSLSIDVRYQPLVNAGTGTIHGVEALARWTNAAGMAVSPDIFIPVAEKSGLIAELGLLVLCTALMDVRDWPDMKLSVNVSPVQLRDPAFPGQVAKALAETGFPPHRLTLEITEGFFIREPAKARRVFAELKALGLSISLDDFGSGYSSIGYLRQFEFDRLKIDRSFVNTLETDSNARDVIHATVALANAFSIPVTAEGVENANQAAILRQAGCDELQGFHFGRPMAPDQVVAALSDSPRKAVA